MRNVQTPWYKPVPLERSQKNTKKHRQLHTQYAAVPVNPIINIKFNPDQPRPREFAAQAGYPFA